MPHRQANAYVAVAPSFLCSARAIWLRYFLRTPERDKTADCGLRNDLLELPLEVFDLIPEPGSVLELEILRGLEHLGFEVGD
jgi:hypothetical protein